jgi:hypothetical protein
MRPKFERTLLGAAAALSLSLAAPAAMAADHRDAPTIDDYSAIDINDVYMFRDPPNCQPGPSCNLVMVLSTQAIADPSFGLTYHFQANALYRFNFSTTPDAIAKGIPTAHIDFVFSPFESSPSCPTAAACQTFRAFFPNGMVVNGLTTQGSANPAPNPPVPTMDGAITIFAGPREDPFFFDLVGFNRFIADVNKQTTTPAVPHFNLFTGKDAFLGKNINAIVMEFPFSMLLRPGQTKLAAWAVTYLGDLDNDETKRGDLRHADHGKHSGELSQVDRMGNPGVNTALISAPLKDAFNFATPADDVDPSKPFQSNIVANLTKYGVNPAIAGILATAAIPDTLKFDTALPDGYVSPLPPTTNFHVPNGRLLTDRTTDFLITLFFNKQNSPAGSFVPASAPPTCAPAPAGVAITGFSDCTEPKTPLSAFPFVGPPLPPP